jgi:hypothetical protein
MYSVENRSRIGFGIPAGIAGMPGIFIDVLFLDLQIILANDGYC